jgi:tripartite-type tricarboxylate transporter receptor subunit TctC
MPCIAAARVVTQSAILIACTVFAAAAPAQAQTYPSKPVRLVVPLAPATCWRAPCRSN